MNAHLIPFPKVGNTQLWAVVLNDEDRLQSIGVHKAVVCKTIEEAFDYAADNNAPMIMNGKDVLLGNFK